MGRYPVVAIAAVLLLAGNAECENVETCAPTRTAIEWDGRAHVVTLHSGDQPLRGRTVDVSARLRGEEVAHRAVDIERGGEARVELGSSVLARADEVVAVFAEDRNYCRSRGNTRDGTGGRTP